MFLSSEMGLRKSAVAVVMEHAGSGASHAAPAARKIMDAWLNKEMAPPVKQPI